MVKRVTYYSAVAIAMAARMALQSGDGALAQVSSHPRIWLTPQVLATIDAKRRSSDADWRELRSAVDRYLGQHVPQMTVVRASNTNPVTFTTAQPLLWSGTASTIYLKGATASWTPINNRPEIQPWAATATGSKTFTIPVDARAFGPFAGQSVVMFIAGGENDPDALAYGYEGDGWYDALLQLGLAYKITGREAYASKALQLIDYMNTLGAQGMVAPVSQDSGRGDMGVTLGLAVAYDWFYDKLTAAQRIATYTTLNRWNAWTVHNAFSITDPVSNYWEAHQTAVASTAYATYGDNPEAPAWLDWATGNWSSHFERTFASPSTIKAAQSSGGLGMYFGGMTALGHNYGGNDISRHLKYMLMVKTATGRDMFRTTDYAQRWLRALLYELKPDRWKSVTWGRWPGSWYGVMALSEPLLLSHVLAGTAEGAWAQWLYTHVNRNIPDEALGFRRPALQDRVMFFDAGRPAADYRTSQPHAAFVDGTNATLYWRSDWSDAADAANFRISPANAAVGDIAKDAGHIDVTRGADYLLVQSDQWKGNAGDDATGAPQLDRYDSGGANTLYFWDRHVKCFDQNDRYDGCQTGYGIYRAPVYRITSEYAYGENEFSSAYDYPDNPSPRTLQYFFRSFVAMHDGTYVVLDRVRSRSADDVKQVRWQLSSANPPVLTHGVVTSTVGASKIAITTLLPASAELTLKRNVDARGNPANWRVQVTDPVPAESYVGLTVLSALPRAGAAPAVGLLRSIDDDFVGVEVGGAAPKVVVLPRGVTTTAGGGVASPRYDGVHLTTGHSGTAAYLIGGLMAGTYSVERNGRPIDGADRPRVESDGVLFFSASAGTFVLRREIR